jgi:lipopolysaccharide/colanic/teichoic acid biosynthesis glycosyltransferase
VLTSSSTFAVAGPKPERLDLTDADANELERLLRSRWLYNFVKRAVEILLVVLSAPAILLIIGIAAIAIVHCMGGPIFYRQERVGYRGCIFRMWKLRTMTQSSEGVATATHVNDKRVTPLGRVLRITHIDELPQFWNVLLGDMTLIGPRPEQVPLVEVYRKLLPNYDLRHLVRPGLSGWSQVRYGYAETVIDTKCKLEYDLFYLRYYGPWMDLKILWSTCANLVNPALAR